MSGPMLLPGPDASRCDSTVRTINNAILTDQRQLDSVISENVTAHVSKLKSAYEFVEISKLNMLNKSLSSRTYTETANDQHIADIDSQCKYYLFEISKRKTSLRIINGQCLPWMFSTDDCMVCAEEYVLKVSLSPCGHALCRKCVMSIYRNVGRRFKCPMCRQQSTGYNFIDTDKFVYKFYKFGTGRGN